MRFAAARLACQDQGAPLRDEIGRERGAEHLQAQRRLVGEIEIVDRLQNGKAGASRQSCQSRLLTMSDFLGGQQGSGSPVGPPLPFRPVDQAAPDAPRIARCSGLKRASRSVSAAIMTGLRRAERMPPCSAASTGSLRSAPTARGVFGALDPSSARQPGGAYRRRPVEVVKGQRRQRRAEIGSDALRADRLSARPRERGAQRGTAVRL